MMKFPPPPHLDEDISTSLYEYYRTVVPKYTDNEIDKFESLHRRIIRSRILAFKNNSKNQEEEALSEQEKQQDEKEGGIKRQPDYDML